jgi:DNA-directed RNA polymerase specialized sigma24 family protein
LVPVCGSVITVWSPVGGVTTDCGTGGAAVTADLRAPARLCSGDGPIAPRLDHARVAACLERLPERERAVLVLSFWDEQPADSVGHSLGLTAGHVRVLRHRGIGKLRRCVNGGRRTA